MKFKLKYVVYGTVFTVLTTFAVSSFVGCSKPEDNPKENPCIDDPCQCDPNAPGCKEEPCVKNPCLCNENAPGCKEEPKKEDLILTFVVDRDRCGNNDPMYTEALSDQNLSRIKNDPKTGSIRGQIACDGNLDGVARGDFGRALYATEQAKIKYGMLTGQSVYMSQNTITSMADSTVQRAARLGITMKTLEEFQVRSGMVSAGQKKAWERAKQNTGM
jgi:hypothetical protein